MSDLLPSNWFANLLSFNQLTSTASILYGSVTKPQSANTIRGRSNN
jgi:hypothetical protein